MIISVGRKKKSQWPPPFFFSMYLVRQTTHMMNDWSTYLPDDIAEIPIFWSAVEVGPGIDHRQFRCGSVSQTALFDQISLRQHSQSILMALSVLVIEVPGGSSLQRRLPQLSASQNNSNGQGSSSNGDDGRLDRCGERPPSSESGWRMSKERELLVSATRFMSLQFHPCNQRSCCANNLKLCALLLYFWTQRWRPHESQRGGGEAHRSLHTFCSQLKPRTGGEWHGELEIRYF